MVGVTFNAEPPFSRKYPAFIFYPIMRFFLTITPSPVLRAVVGYTGITYH
jgi:hypothetical protein